MTITTSDTPRADTSRISAQTIPFPDFTRVSELNESVFGETAKFNAQFGAAMQRLGREWMEFVGLRLREEMNLMQAIHTSRTLPDMQQAFAQFWQTAFTQYGEEAQRLVRITHGAMDDASRTVRDIRETASAPPLSPAPADRAA